MELGNNKGRGGNVDGSESLSYISSSTEFVSLGDEQGFQPLCHEADIGGSGRVIFSDNAAKLGANLLVDGNGIPAMLHQL